MKRNKALFVGLLIVAAGAGVLLHLRGALHSHSSRLDRNDRTNDRAPVDLEVPVNALADAVSRVAYDDKSESDRIQGPEDEFPRVEFLINDDSGSAVAGAAVRVVRMGIHTSGRTDHAGRLSLASSSPGTATASISAEGFAPCELPVWSRIGGGEVVVVTLIRAATIRLVLTSPEQGESGFADVQVVHSAFSTKQKRSGCAPHETTVLRVPVPSETFISDLHPGRLYLRAGGAPWAPELAQVSIQAEETASVELSLRRGSPVRLSFELEPYGEPWSGARFSLSSIDRDGRKVDDAGPLSAGDDGERVVWRDPSHTLFVRAPMSPSGWFQKTEVPPGVEEVRIRGMEREPLVALVITPDGRRVLSGVMETVDDDGTLRSAVSFADEDGFHDLPGQGTPAPPSIRFIAESGETSRWCKFPTMMKSRIRTLVVSAPVEIRGRVVLHDGVPATGLPVYLTCLGRPVPVRSRLSDDRRASQQSTTNETGSFAFMVPRDDFYQIEAVGRFGTVSRCVFAGTADIAARTLSYRALEHFVMSSANDRHVDAGDIVIPSTATLKVGLTGLAQNERRLVALESLPGGPGGMDRYRLTDSSGEAVFSDVIPGTYRVYDLRPAPFCTFPILLKKQRPPIVVASGAAEYVVYKKTSD
jgi:hypothetical protein